MSETRLTIAERTEPTVHWSDDQVHILRTELFKDLNAGQLALFAQVCRRTGLDPFAKQIYAIIRGGKLTIQTSIDGYRLTAQRSGRYNGQTPPEWYDGERWVDVWLDAAYPKAARIGVYIAGAEQPTWGVATWGEYAPDDNTLAKPAGAMWRKMPALMLVKCAEALALRKAFPAELAGVYTDDEMQGSAAAAVEATSDEPLTPEQTQELVALLEAGGMSAATAMAHANGITQHQFERALMKAQRLVDERAEVVDADPEVVA